MAKSAPLNWIGGKYYMVNNILPYLPETRIYAEAYGGGASILQNKPKAQVEFYNDLNAGLVNFFRVLQDPKLNAALHHRVCYTLYAQDEFRRALALLKEPSADVVENAWAFFVAYNMGFSGKCNSEGSFGYCLINERLPNKLISSQKEFKNWLSRWQTVTIFNEDALHFIKRLDCPDILFYLDPPYAHSTRTSSKDYKHEMTDADHAALVELLLTIQGKACLSCYYHDVYAPLIDAGWRRVDFRVTASSAASTKTSGLKGVAGRSGHKRTETLLMNYTAPNLKLF